MSDRFGALARALVAELSRGSGTVVSETVEVCRVAHASCAEPGRLGRIKELATVAANEGAGKVALYGDIQDAIDLAVATEKDIEQEPVSLVIEKATDPAFRPFITIEGFRSALEGDGFLVPGLVVWLPATFAPFTTEWMTVEPWGGPRVHLPASFEATSPRKLVWDELGGIVPPRVDAWLPRDESPKASAVFAAWREVAVDRLASALPSQIRSTDSGPNIVMRGPRSAPIAIAPLQPGESDALFPMLAKAARWVYGTPRETETKFQFLNNHLSLDWRDGSSWPSGLAAVLEGSLANAKEAFGFHLQEQSKDALKSLGDLRKALQEEVAKSQSATRDLLGALWRDSAIAGVVLALKSPTAAQFGIQGSEVLRWVTLATAVVLSASLLVTVGSNWRFNVLADQGRREWRGKLYAFLSNEDWLRLVERPIARARWVYRTVCPIVVTMYLVAIYYLVLVALPEWTIAHIDPWLGWISSAFRES